MVEKYNIYFNRTQTERRTIFYFTTIEIDDKIAAAVQQALERTTIININYKMVTEISDSEEMLPDQVEKTAVTTQIHEDDRTF